MRNEKSRFVLAVLTRVLIDKHLFYLVTYLPIVQMITYASQTKWRLEADEKLRKKIQKHLDSFVVVN